MHGNRLYSNVSECYSRFRIRFLLAIWRPFARDMVLAFPAGFARMLQEIYKNMCNRREMIWGFWKCVSRGARWPLSSSTARASSPGSLAGCQDRGKRITGMNRSLFRRLETGYRLSKAALVVEISRSQSCFVVESDLATTQLQTAITYTFDEPAEGKSDIRFVCGMLHASSSFFISFSRLEDLACGESFSSLKTAV